MTYQEAIDKRTEMERTCTDADCWEELAQAFEAMGALSAAAACRRRAEHYGLFTWTCSRCGASHRSDVEERCPCEYDVQHS